MTQVNLDQVYAEVKRLRIELKSIEKSLDSLVESLIPVEKISPEEEKELREIEKEMEQGEYVTLEEVMKPGVKKRARISHTAVKKGI
jgi:hypothetical protein